MERIPTERSQETCDLKEPNQVVSQERRFVVLEHRNSAGVHWDLMIEIEPGGPLRTWAIDCVEALNRESVARPLPDHRRSYLDYEGPISGGRGEVKRWDEGTCLIHAFDETEVLLTFRGSQLEGPGSLRLIARGPESESSWLFRLGKFN